MSSFNGVPLEALGFTPFLGQQLSALEGESAPRIPERVAAEHRSEYTLVGPLGVRRAMLSGRLRHELSPAGTPCVGDWVVCDESTSDPARIEHVLERTTVFSRKAIGRSSELQPIAANVDVVLVVCALSAESTDAEGCRRALGIRRLERYLRAVSDAGCRGVVVVNKADLVEDAASRVADVRDELGRPELVLVSAETSEGLAELEHLVGKGETAVLTGPSGVGKSSLVNRLLGDEVQRTGAVRADDLRGRHTTTHRELFLLPRGGVLIDTPGMRELGLSGEDTQGGFDDVAELASQCRFSDCDHRDEPGCAVRDAVDAGSLDPARLESARKLEREARFQRERHDANAQRANRSRYRALSRSVRARLIEKGRKD